MRLNSETGKSGAGPPHSKMLRFKAELYIDEPPPVVWRYFTDLTQWNRWSPICRECLLLGDAIEAGSALQISFTIAGITTTVAAKLIDVRPPNLITWRGSKFGLNALHTYSFLPHHSGTLMKNEEKVFGAVFPLSILIRGWYRISKLSYRSLDGIKRTLLIGKTNHD